MTFGLAYNTDFPEAEVNDQQINLTRIFQENADFFELGHSLPGVPSLEPFLFRGGLGSSPFGTIELIDCEPV